VVGRVTLSAMTDTTLERVDQITTGDVPGLAGDDTHPITTSTTDPFVRAVQMRTATLRRFLEVVAPLPIQGRLWIPDLAGATGGGVQPAEKAEFPAADLAVTGQTYSPELVGGAVNASWQVMQAAGSTIELLLEELALRATVDYVIAQLTDAAVPATDFGDAAAQIEGAGWPVNFVAGSTAELLSLDLQALNVLAIPVFAGLPIDGVLVGSLAGTWGGVSETALRQAEPAIAGFEVGAFAEVIFRVAPGSVALIPATP